jgi:Ca2+-binding RTX toxin-like protein
MRRIVLVLSLMAVLVVVASGVAWAVVQTGTDGNDRLSGTNDGDTQYGLDGDDWLVGHGGPDNQYGGRGRDTLLGDGGQDNQYGGQGGDRVRGGSGRDEQHLGQSADRAFGGPGNDYIQAEDEGGTGTGGNDFVDCGAGTHDFAERDPGDTVVNCENVS